jgi:aryl-alcohol dehydrogenase-like predicted oxidoreductase
MSAIEKSGTYALGERTVKRLGYGAMQLAGKGVFGPPKDRDQAIAVLRQAVEAGVDHIDTSDFYGPHITNQIIREALHPYPDDLTLVTKVGAKRGPDGSWPPAFSPAELKSAVHDNLRNLGLERLDVVNLRVVYGLHGPKEGPIEEQVHALAELQKEGLIRHVGISNATPKQIETARGITEIVCVQNMYNYVPFFPLGGFTPLQSSTLSGVAERLGVTPMQVALAWLLHRSPNILLIPGTSSPAHLTENLAVAEIDLPEDALSELNAMAA